MYSKILKIQLLIVQLFFSLYVFSQNKIIDKLPEHRRLELDNHFYEGNKEYLLNNFSKAEIEFKKCLEILPQHFGSLYMMGVVSSSRQEFTAAINYFVKADKIEINKWCLEELAGVYMQIQKYDDAAKAYIKVYEKCDDNTMWLKQAARMYTTGGKYKNALSLYKKIEKKDGYNEEIALSREQIFLAQNKKDKAVNEIKRLVKAYPDNLHLMGMLADLYIDIGKENEGIAIYNKILEKEPQNGLAHFALSEYYVSKGKPDKGFEELKKAFADRTIDIKLKMQQVLSRFQQMNSRPEATKEIEVLAQILEETHPESPLPYRIFGDLYMQTEHYNEARNKYEQSLLIDENAREVFAQLMDIDLKLKDDDALEKHSRRATELFPQLPGFFYFNAVACQQLKKYEQCIQSAISGLELAPTEQNIQIQLLSTLGDAAYFAKNYSLSDSAYEQALLIDSNNVYVLNNYSYFLSVRGKNLEKAERLSHNTLLQFPDNATYQDTYGWILFKEGKYTDAEKYIGDAIKQSADNAEVLEHYGDVSYKTGNKERALEYWKKAKDAGGISEILLKKIKEKMLFE